MMWILQILLQFEMERLDMDEFKHLNPEIYQTVPKTAEI